MSKTIRNVAVLGHQGSGKTSLIESLSSIVSNRPKGSVRILCKSASTSSVITDLRM